MDARKSAIFFLEQKYLFCANLVPKFKIICLKRSLVPIRICRNRCRCSLFPFLTGNALLREIQLQNSRFNGEAHIFCFRQEILFLCKFNPKYQNCPFKVKYNTQTHSSFQNLIVMFTFSFFDRKYGKIWENLLYEKKRRGVVVITTAQLSPTRSTLGFKYCPQSVGNL